MKRDDVPEGLDYGRRRFLGSAAMTAAHLGMFGSPSPLGGFGPPSTLRGFGETGTAEAQDCVPRELAAIGRATDAIWRAFSNRYWPALYFLDARSRIRDYRFGEGEYEKSERIIQRLLKDAGIAASGDGIVPVADVLRYVRLIRHMQAGNSRSASARAGEQSFRTSFHIRVTRGSWRGSWMCDLRSCDERDAKRNVSSDP